MNNAWRQSPSRTINGIVAAFGEIIQDVIVVPAKALSYGGGHVDGRISYSRGGCGPNVAVGCAQLGLRSRFIGHRGDDDTGEQLEKQLRRANVEVAGPVRGETASSLSIATPDGDTALVFSPGDSRSMCAADFTAQHLAEVGVLHLNSHHLYSADTRGAFWKLVQLARESEALISLDISAANRLQDYGVTQYRQDLAALRPEILMGNEAEAAVLGVLEQYPRGVEMTLVHRGSKPTLAMTPQGTQSVPVILVPNVVDTTGAGDAFASGFLTTWMRGGNLGDSITAAHDFAAQTIVHPGFTPDARASTTK